MNTRTESIDLDEWWLNEVETWFLKSLTDGILQGQFQWLYEARHGAPEPWSFLQNTSFAGVDFRTKYPRCDRIVFYHGEYTNINWLGFWIATCSLSTVSIMSYFIKSIVDLTRNTIRQITIIWNILWKRSLVTTHVRLFPSRHGKVTLGASVVWNFVSRFFSEVRLWPRSVGTKRLNAYGDTGTSVALGNATFR